jgi:hypothetical protein
LFLQGFAGYFFGDELKIVIFAALQQKGRFLVDTTTLSSLKF